MKTTISYNDETIASLDPGQSATLLCDGQRMKSNLRVKTESLVFGKILQSTGNSETDAISQKVITQEFENTFSKINQLESGCVIKEQASGDIVALTDSANAPIESLGIYGKTTQAAEPTPEDPQELVSVGADGDIKVNITRKNLLKTTNYTKGSINSSTGVAGENENVRSYCLTTDFIYLKSGNYVLSNATGANLRYIAFYDLNKYFVSATWMDRKKVFSFTVVKDCYARVDVERDANVEIENFDTFISDFKFMLEVGTIATDYEPYQEPTAMTIPTPIALNGVPVTKNGNFTDASGQQWVTDEIDFERGVRIQRVKEIVLTGNEGGWSKYNTSTEGYNSFRNTLFDGVNIGNLQNLCTHYKALAGFFDLYYGKKQGCYVGATNENECKLVIGDVHSTVEDFKAYLAEQYSNDTPVKVKYVLAEPIETPLTEAELVAYQEYYTNYPNTTIYSDDGAFLNIKYKADTKHYIDNKFNSLEKAILSLGGNI